MAISINPATYVISIPQADLTFLGGANYQLDTNWFRFSLRDWEDGEDGIYQPNTHNHNTTVLLGGIQYARVIEILSPYTVTFQETGTPYVVSLVGSNNNILEKTNLGTVQILSNNSAGLINVTEVQYSAFSNYVTIDVGNVTGNATSGTTYPAGTEASPSNNLSDTLVIAAARGFYKIKVIGDLAIGATNNVSGLTFIGQGTTLNISKTTITLVSGCVTTNTTFNECKVVGVEGGESEYINCTIGSLSNANCSLTNCALIGPIVFSASVVGSPTTNIIACYTGNNEVTLNQNGSSLSFAIQDFGGRLKFTNGTHIDSLSRVHMRGGTVTIDATCTASTYVLTGWCSVVNLSTAVVDTTGLIRSIVWDELIADHLTAGTTGKALSDAGSAGNPWGSPVTGNTDPGTFGELVGKKLLTVAKFLGLK